MITGLFALLTLFMVRWPEIALSRWLHRHLVVKTMELAGRLERRHLIFLIIGFAIMYSFAEMGMPHLGFAAAVDISGFVDMIITVSTVAAIARTRESWSALRARFVRPRNAGKARVRARRRLRRTTQRPPANDDDGHGAFARAA